MTNFYNKRITPQYEGRYIATILLFLSVLLGLRWAWSEIYSTSEHPHAARGVLNIRGLYPSINPIKLLSIRFQLARAIPIRWTRFVRSSRGSAAYDAVPQNKKNHPRS